MAMAVPPGGPPGGWAGDPPGGRAGGPADGQAGGPTGSRAGGPPGGRAGGPADGRAGGRAGGPDDGRAGGRAGGPDDSRAGGRAGGPDDGRPDGDDGGDFEEEREKIKTARRLQELFRGRFTQLDSIKLLKHNDWDLNNAVNFCFEGEPQDIREVLNEQQRQVIDNCRHDAVLHNDAVANQITIETRQFACQDCDNVWWRNVSVRKRVSRCNKCGRKYDCLSREQEWGWAIFQCQCGNEFHGFGAMNKTESRCYVERCQRPCRPTKIVPPSKRRNYRRSRDRHSCTADNCYNRARVRPNVPEPAVNICVHPKSLREKVVEPSRPHTSTGSTVKTFLTQDDLVSESDYVPSLADIDELGDDNGDNR